MGRVLKGLGILLGGIVTVAVIVSIAARFSDGPIAAFAGGPLVAGELVTEAVDDWTFVEDVDTVEFQLEHPARSRTVWIIVHEGQLYIPCGLPNFKVFKQWPHEAMQDGRSIVRIDGKRYPLQAVRMQDPGLFDSIASKIAKKYPAPAEASPDDLWIFRMDPRG